MSPASLSNFRTVSGVPQVQPDGFLQVFAEANMSNPMNATISRLGMSDEDILKVRTALRDLGQSRFINLSRNYLNSATVLAMYAGDGIVAKVIGERELSHVNDVIYHVPALSKEVVEGRDERFHIRLYPWIPPGNVDQDVVNTFAQTLRRYGLEFNAGDAHPKNVHTLPDLKGTRVGIDSHMYHASKSGVNIPDDVLDAWHRYLHALYPIYDAGKVPPQTPETSFAPKSLHDPNAGLISFDDYMSRSGGLRPPESEHLTL